MPPLPAIVGALKLLLHYAAPGIPSMINRLFFHGTGNPTTTALNAYCTAVSNAWNINVAPTTMPGASLVAVTAEDLSSPTGAVGAWTGALPGKIANGGPMDASAALVIENLINRRQRGGHSRTFLPGPNSQWLQATDAGTWNPAAIAAAVANWAAFIAAITGSGGPTGFSGSVQAAPHYYSGSVGSIAGVAPNTRGVTKVTPLANPSLDFPIAQIGSTIVGNQTRRNHSG